MLKYALDIIRPYIENNVIFIHDNKSYLQEMVQTDQRSVTYNVISESGLSHDKTFEVKVLVDGIVYAKGIGKSKKEAEQNAARNAILISAGDVNETVKN